MLFCFFSTTAVSAYAQEKTDTIVLDAPVNLGHSPKKATIYSAILPGLGQAYNQDWWTIPAIYVAFAGAIYAVDFNNREYNRFKTAYLTFPNDEFEGNFTQEQLLSYVEEYRRWRELSVIGIVLVWGLNVIDANVNGHFYQYDISPDISLKVEPIFRQNVTVGSELGLKFALKF